MLQNVITKKKTRERYKMLPCHLKILLILKLFRCFLVNDISSIMVIIFLNLAVF